jgi:uncharacterized protein (TIGR03382 family)
VRPSLIALLLVLPTVANALPSGITGYSGRGGGSTCSGCHSGTATAPTVAITGPATLTAGMTGNYTLTITGGPAKTAGMNVSLGGANSANAVFTAGTGNKLSSGELVHSAPAAVIANVATFSFAVKAPLTAGVFTLSAAALSTNNDSLVTGDGTGTTSLDVNVSLTASSPPVGMPDGGGVAPVLPGTDAGTPAPASGSDAGTSPAPTVKPDAGTPAATPPAPIVTSTGGRAEPLSDGVVEGEGCSAVGGMPLLGLVALALLALARRARPVAVPASRE